MPDYTFDRDLACKIGVEESIMVSNFVYWLQHNKANRKHYHDGRYWTYNSVQAFTELFPFWTTKQLRRIMESLYAQNVILKGNYNQQSFDRTGWYSLSDDYVYLLGIMHLPKQANGIAEKGNTIPNSNTDSKQSSSNEEDNGELPLKSVDAFTLFITQINKVSGRKFKKNDSVKKQFVARLKEGYSYKDIIQAFKNAMVDKYHIETDFNHLTTEFITRPDKLEKYLNYSIAKKEDKSKGIVINF
jgi:hypothetical protein